MTKVLLVAEPLRRDALRDALNALGFDVRACSPKEAVGSVDDAQVIAVAVFPDDVTAPKFVAHLQSNLKSGAPPVVVAVARDAAARDAALIAGAADVAFSPSPDALAASVHEVMSPWQKTTPRIKLGKSVRAQTGRTALELVVDELDVSGVSLEANSGLGTGQLVRLQLPLDGRELVAWGRTVVDEEATGIRFIARSASERARLKQAVEAWKPISAAVVPSESEPPDAGKAESVEEDNAADVQSSALDAGLTPNESVDSTLVEDGDLTTPPEAPETQPPSDAAATQEEPPDVADLADGQADAQTTGESAEAEVSTNGVVSENARPQPESGSESESGSGSEPEGEPEPVKSSLASAIGDALNEELGLSDDDEQEESLAVVRREWPAGDWETDACVERLQAASSVSLADGAEDLAGGATLLDFLRSVSPFERRVFSAEPPSELPPVEVSQKCLALRLRCFVIVQEARLSAGEGEDVRWTVDGEKIAALKREVEQARAEIQKLVDAMVLGAETTRIHDANVFATSLNKAFEEVTREAARLSGEADGPAGSVALLDVAEPGAEPTEPTRRKAPGKAVPAKGSEAKERSVVAFKRRTPEQKARQRLVSWLVVLALAIVVSVVFAPEKTKTLSPEDYRGLTGISEIKVPPVGRNADRPQAAIVTVSSTWQPDAESVKKLKTMLRGKEVERFAVFNTSGDFLAMGLTDAKAVLTVTSGR